MAKKTGPTRVKLSDFRERKELEGAIDVETDDGQVFRIPPPELWPDDVLPLAQAKDIVGMARRILGDESYDKFTAAGGSAGILNAIFVEHHGTAAGE